MTSKQNFGRIHRSSLGVMGLLRLNFKDKSGQDAATADHAATFSLTGLNNDLNPRQEVTLTVKKSDSSEAQFPLIFRIDTPVEIDYYRAGGILPYVLTQILAS